MKNHKKSHWITDSSGIIYLHHQNLLDSLFSCVQCYTTLAVKNELCRKPDGIETYFDNTLIHVLPDTDIPFYNRNMSPADRGLIALAMEKSYPLLSDDREICLFCDTNQIPFYNSLTAVVFLHEKGVIELDVAYEKIHHLAKAGRYSKKIVQYALSLLP